MNKYNSNDFIDNYDDELISSKRYKNSSRSREKNKARRKIDAYLERKLLKELFDDYDDFDDMSDYMESDDNRYLNDSMNDNDWLDSRSF
ncbi:MAG: hypothetical protein OQL19_06665 [Gammaproteobacteria bacterium]|nr:hypothetical protein [Gammaproteobacteria bacterium]